MYVYCLHCNFEFNRFFIASIFFSILIISMSHFCIAQAIQRQLEEVAEKQRDLEERGVAIEKIIRGETGTEQYTTHRPLPYKGP